VKKKVITICCSASFYKDVLEIEKKLKVIGYKILVPETILKMKKTGNFRVNDYKTWYKNSKDYKIKKKLMDNHFKKVIKGDEVLIVNNKKNGMEGYIGGNTLMEMTIAYYFKKPIFILNEISKKSPIAEEIFGMFPIFLNGKIENIKV
jgi:hypothetical protein